MASGNTPRYVLATCLFETQSCVIPKYDYLVVWQVTPFRANNLIVLNFDRSTWNRTGTGRVVASRDLPRYAPNLHLWLNTKFRVFDKFRPPIRAKDLKAGNFYRSTGNRTGRIMASGNRACTWWYLACRDASRYVGWTCSNWFLSRHTIGSLTLDFVPSKTVAATLLGHLLL